MCKIHCGALWGVFGTLLGALMPFDTLLARRLTLEPSTPPIFFLWCSHLGGPPGHVRRPGLVALQVRGGLPYLRPERDRVRAGAHGPRHDDEDGPVRPLGKP